MSDERLTAQDCLDVGFCLRRGVKPACELHGVDFKRLVREGIPLAELAELKDVNVDRAVRRARERIQNGR